MLNKSGSPEENSLSNLLLPAVSIYLLLVLLMPDSGHGWDNYCWAEWAQIVHRGGLAEAYSPYSPVNYLPLYLYVLKAYGWLVGTDNIPQYIHCLKAFTLLFDIGSMILLCRMLLPGRQLKLFIIGLVNVAYLYNTMVWNQVDSIMTFFVFTSFLAAWHKRTLLSVFLFVLAINFKLQSLFFLPVIAYLWLRQYNARLLLKMFAVLLVTELVILAPFLVNGNTKQVLKVALGSVGYFPNISMNGFNFWYLVVNSNPMKTPDNIPFILGLSYKTVGLILFFAFSAIVCIPMYLRLVRKAQNELDLRKLLLACALLGYFFFYWNTQIHERYIHPVLIFSTALAFLYGHWLQWVFTSLAYVLSLEGILQYLRFYNYSTLIFDPRFIALLYAIAMMQLLYLWINGYRKQSLPEARLTAGVQNGEA